MNDIERLGSQASGMPIFSNELSRVTLLGVASALGLDAGELARPASPAAEQAQSPQELPGIVDTKID